MPYLISPAAQIVHPLSLAAAENLGLPKDCILVRASTYFESFLLLSHFFPSPCQKVTLSVSVGHNDLNDIVLQNSKAINFYQGKQFNQIHPDEKGFQTV